MHVLNNCTLIFFFILFFNYYYFYPEVKPYICLELVKLIIPLLQHGVLNKSISKQAFLRYILHTADTRVNTELCFLRSSHFQHSRSL